MTAVLGLKKLVISIKVVSVFLLMLPVPIYGQKLIINVINEKQEPIPYCSIHWNKTMGLITDSLGILEISSISSVDSLVVQSLGYETKVVPRTQIHALEKLTIVLKPKSIQLPEVVVWRVKDHREYGITVRKEGFIYFKNATCTNSQMAIKITGYINPSKLESVSYFISSSSQGSIPFRIRVYEINEQGLPGNDLLNENIIVHDYKNGNWNSFNLSGYNVTLPDSGFFVAMEWMCHDLNGGNGLCLAGTDEINTALTFYYVGTAGWRDYNLTSKRGRPTNFLLKAKLGFPAK